MDKNDKLKLSEKISMSVFALCFIGIAFSTGIINRFNIESIRLFNVELSSVSFSGITTSLETIIAVYLTIHYRKAGFICSVILQGIYVLVMSSTVFMTQNMSAVPGVSIILCSIAAVCIIRKYASENSKKEQQLYDLAFTDSLTKLPNRREFQISLEDAIVDKSVDKFAVVFIDFDNFKNLNDAMGHTVGDDFLRTAVIRWQRVTKESDFLIRQGGDEFAIIIKGYKSREELYNHVCEFSDVLGGGFVSGDKSFYLSASFGIALYPDDSTDSEELQRYADMAMYDAKRNPKTHVCFYDKNLDEKMSRYIIVEHRLREALSKGDFYLMYQPQYCINPKKLRGFETLMRMRTDNGKEQIGPGEFIPVAEKCGFITEIDKWVLKQALGEFKSVLDSGHSELMLAINISISHLLSANFIDDVRDALESTDFPPQNLEIELTESVLISSIARAVDILDELKEMGITIALDDFGTGYASLSYLTKLPIDLLKVDKSFVDILLNNDGSDSVNRDGSSFIEAIISMGHVLDFEVISEGVECESQLEILKRIKCDFIQGFLWGKPLNLNEVQQLVSGTDKAAITVTESETA